MWLSYLTILLFVLCRYFRPDLCELKPFAQCLTLPQASIPTNRPSHNHRALIKNTIHVVFITVYNVKVSLKIHTVPVI